MDTKEIEQAVKKLARDLPRFSDGRIDYTTAKEAPVIGVIVKHKDKILIVKRSRQVGFYPGKWNWVSGFIDEVKPLRDFVLDELREELGLDAGAIADMGFSKVVREPDSAIGKVWRIYPVVVEVSRPIKPKLDWEASAYRWINPKELGNFETVPNVVANIRHALTDTGG